MIILVSSCAYLLVAAATSASAAAHDTILDLCVAALGLYALIHLARSRSLFLQRHLAMAEHLEQERRNLDRAMRQADARSIAVSHIVDGSSLEQVQAAIADFVELTPNDREVAESGARLLGLAIERRATSQTIRFQASHDLMTGLPNRPGLINSLQRITNAGEVPTVLAIDLIGFKEVNTTYGTTVGNEVLAETARRLRDCIGYGDVAGRLAGDEFAVILGEASRFQAEQAAGAIIERLREPVIVGAVIAEVSANVGIVVGADALSRASNARERSELVAEQCPERLLDDANRALLVARSGPDSVVVFDDSVHDMIEQQRELELDLRRAIAVQGFDVAFQPLVATSDGTIRGVEALARWVRNGEPCSPGEFLPLAERTGLIAEIDRLVLAQACREVANCRRRGMPDLELSANLSGVHLMLGDLVGFVSDVLASSGLPPTALTLEITETAFVDGGGEVSERLAELRELGVRIAVDDFGTGYSALQYLQRLPVDELKVDKAFVDDLGQNGPNDALVRAVVGMARAFNLLVVAEGVEHEHQVRVLEEIGCDLCQGFYFARPMPVSELLRWAADSDTLRLPVLRV